MSLLCGSPPLRRSHCSCAASRSSAFNRHPRAHLPLGPSLAPPPGASGPHTWAVQGSGPKSPSGRGGRSLERPNRAGVFDQWGAAHVGPFPGGQARWRAGVPEGTPTPVSVAPPALAEDSHAGAQGHDHAGGKAQQAPRNYTGAAPTHVDPIAPRLPVPTTWPIGRTPPPPAPHRPQGGAVLGLWSGPSRDPSAVVPAGARGARAPRPAAGIRALRQPKALPRAPPRLYPSACHRVC